MGERNETLFSQKARGKAPLGPAGPQIKEEKVLEYTAPILLTSAPLPP